MVTRSVAAHNVFGLAATFANATFRFGQTAVTGNSVSTLPSSGAVLQSYGDDYIDGDGDPAPSTIARK